MTSNLLDRFGKTLKRAQIMYNAHGPLPLISYTLSKFSLFKWLFRKSSLDWLIRVKVHGNTMYLNAHDPGISNALLIMGTREKPHIKQIEDNIKKGMTGIDLGSNIGFHSLIEACLVGQRGKIYSIEPEPKNLKLLKKNIGANGLDNRFSVSQYLIGDRDGVGKLYLSAFSNRHSASIKNRYGVLGREKAPHIEISMLTLDSFMDKNNLLPKDIDFIRMDIEGYEVMVFKGMKKLLTAGTPLKIFIELHPKWFEEWGWDFEKFLNYIESFNLNITNIVYKGWEGVKTIKKPSRKQILETEQASPLGASHAVIERL